MSVSAEQPKKALSPMTVTAPAKRTFSSPVHCSKSLSGMLVIAAGSVTSFIAAQP